MQEEQGLLFFVVQGPGLFWAQETVECMLMETSELICCEKQHPAVQGYRVRYAVSNSDQLSYCSVRSVNGQDRAMDLPNRYPAQSPGRSSRASAPRVL